MENQVTCTFVAFIYNLQNMILKVCNYEKRETVYTQQTLPGYVKMDSATEGISEAVKSLAPVLQHLQAEVNTHMLAQVPYAAPACSLLSLLFSSVNHIALILPLRLLITH